MSGRGLAASLVLVLSALPACRAPDPRQELEVTGVETYWAIDAPSGETNFIAPVVRFHVRNKGSQSHRAVSAMATFQRKGEGPGLWPSAYHQVSPPGKVFGPGDTKLVVLKPEGEGRYSSPGAPESMFQHPRFRDVHASVFLRMGAGGWVKVIESDIERRIGPRSEVK